MTPWAVITGASSGIGRAFAHACARRGVELVLVARRADPLTGLADELTAAHGTRAHAVATDLRHGTADVRAATAGLDVGLLVAAAGFGTSGPLLSHDLAVEKDMLAVNCAAVLDLTWHYGRPMTRRGRGGIVLLSSILAYQGQPRAAHYAATKAYVHTLAEGLHRELRPHGVDVLAAAPGPVASGFADRADMRMRRALSPDRVADPALDALAAHRPVATPGALSRLLRGGLAPLPRRLRVSIMGAVMADMTRHQAASSPDRQEPAQ